MDGLIFKIVLFVLLFSIGWFVGRHVEQKHLRTLEEKERALAHIGMDTNKFKTSQHSGQLIESNVVISNDYFKYVIAQIQNFFGGRLTTYESVVDRARREAIVRLKQKALDQNCQHIMGLRLSTTELGMEGGMVEVFAYGTAIKTHQ